MEEGRGVEGSRLSAHASTAYTGVQAANPFAEIGRTPEVFANLHDMVSEARFRGSMDS
jgi:hypothetical protein